MLRNNQNDDHQNYIDEMKISQNAEHGRKGDDGIINSKRGHRSITQKGAKRGDRK